MSSSVVYVGHLPFGFFEEQLKQYFSQFGKIVRIRISRNKRTGKSKSYGFVEFACPKVAEIAASAMNNYLMFNKILKCHVMPKDKIHHKLFIGANQKLFPTDTGAIHTKLMNKAKTPKKERELRARLATSLKRKNAQLLKMGIKFSFPLPRAAAGGDSKKKVSSQNDSVYSMIVDSSDDEISFNTPKNVVKKSAKKSKQELSTEEATTSRKDLPKKKKERKKQDKNTEDVNIKKALLKEMVGSDLVAKKKKERKTVGKRMEQKKRHLEKKLKRLGPAPKKNS